MPAVIIAVMAARGTELRTVVARGKRAEGISSYNLILLLHHTSFESIIEFHVAVVSRSDPRKGKAGDLLRVACYIHEQ